MGSKWAKWGYVCLPFLSILIDGVRAEANVFEGIREPDAGEVRSEIQSSKQDSQYFSISPALNYFYAASPRLKYLNPVFYGSPVFYEPKFQFPPPFNADYYERLLKSHPRALAPCIDHQSLQNPGQSNIIKNSGFGYCTSATSCLSSSLTDFMSDGNLTLIWRLISAASQSLRPTCLYLSNDGTLRNGVCCQNQNASEIIVDISQAQTDTSNVDAGADIHSADIQNEIHKFKTVTQPADRPLMDRGHIFSRPSGPDGSNPSNDQKPGDLATSTKDSDTDSDYPFSFIPTHPPLPTHNPEIFNKPWWITSPKQSTTTTGRPTRVNEWWHFQTPTRKPTPWWDVTTTPKPTTTKWWVTTRKSTVDPLKWWETTTTTTPATTTKKPTTIPVRWWEKQHRVVPPRTATSNPSRITDSSGYCGPTFRDAVPSYEPMPEKNEGNTSRITGGAPVTPNSFPWLAVLFIGPKHVCGGSLIDDVHILTASHCVATLTSWQMSQLKVLLGVHNLRDNEHTVQEFSVKTVVRHKDYSRSLLYNDVAILTLNGAVRFTQTVRPICLYTGQDSFVGEYATVAGWGSLFEGGVQLDTPRKVDLQIWSNDECRAAYGRAAPGGIVSSYLCAGKQGKDACSGDSGGPMVKIIGGVWKQIGIVSWGIGCGKGHYPGVYSRISYFLPWINKVKQQY